MGMYTEIFFRAEINPDAEVLPMLGLFVIGSHPTELPKHHLFELDRWPLVFIGGSASFPREPVSELSSSRYLGEGPTLVIHSNLKNYDGEIEAFFNWIDPYLATGNGGFVGYSLYEEVDAFTGPTLYYKGGWHA